MRLKLGSISLLALTSSARATAIDPHLIVATGGDATDITTIGTSVTLSPKGGGIFAFHNATGGPLSQIDLNVQFPESAFPNGFEVDATIFVPSPGQHSTFSDTPFNGATCDGRSSDSFSCLKMVFGLVPGPFIGTGQNFVLDFYFPLTAVDTLVASGEYNLANCEQLVLGCTGTTNLSATRSGDWPDSALVSVIPVPIPEPGTSGALLLGGVGLAIYRCWRKNTVHRSKDGHHRNGDQQPESAVAGAPQQALGQQCATQSPNARAQRRSDFRFAASGSSKNPPDDQAALRSDHFRDGYSSPATRARRDYDRCGIWRD